MKRALKLVGVGVMVAAAYARRPGAGKGDGFRGDLRIAIHAGGTGRVGRVPRVYEGSTSQTPAMLVGIAEIKPGQQNHAPHLHADEEFLYVIDGDGTWTLGDKTLAAHAGDILYSAPGVLHQQYQEHVGQAVEVAGGEVEE